MSPTPIDRREEFLRVVDDRDADAVLFAPLVDGLYAASHAGKRWVSETTLADQFALAGEVGYHAAFVRGSAPELHVNPALTDCRTERTAQTQDERRYVQTLETPAGTVTRELVERAGEGITPVSDFIADASGLPVADWISEQILAGLRDEAIRATWGEFVRECRPHGVTQVQLELPYFLYSLAGFADKPLMMLLTEADQFARSMDLAERALHRVAGILVEVGVDFVWIGAPGTELLSPDIWRRVIIPQSRRFVEHVHGLGGRVHFHCCGQSQLWIDKGFYNEIGIDVVETLSPPDSGNVDDLAAARAAIDASIVTRGNIDLGLLRDGSAQQCADAARTVIEATRGYPHLVALADAVLQGTPVENLHAIQQVCAHAG